MASLFSVFDHQTMFPLTNNWLIIFLSVSFFPPIWWVNPNQSKLFITFSPLLIQKEFKALLNPFFSPPTTFLTVSLFILIFLTNFLGLLPFAFTPSSHLSLTLSLAFPLWVGHMLWNWTKTPASALAHLVPMSTPNPLIPFMVIIELTSNFIRPLTLSIRLAANMVAGHLLLSLLSQQNPFLPFSFLCLIFFSVILLCTLESAVAIIQAYVFSILSTLYVNEVTSNKMNH